MMKDYKGKAIAGAAEVPTPAIVCVAECWSPGLGHFNVGDIVTDHGTVKQLSGNPNFQELKEEDK